MTAPGPRIRTSTALAVATKSAPAPDVRAAARRWETMRRLERLVPFRLGSDLPDLAPSASPTRPVVRTAHP